MKYQVLYPYNVKEAEIREFEILFPGNNLVANIIEKYSDFIYKISINNNILCFIHDGKYAACDFWGKNQLLHNNSDMGFWQIPKYKSLFAEVSKNACSTVVSEIYNRYYREENDYFLEPNDWVWDFLFKNPKKRAEMNLSVQDFLSDSQKDYKTIFLVYDDPINRFVKMLNNKYTCQHFVLSSLQPPYDKNLQEFISKAILLVKLNSMNYEKWDQHVVPISTYHQKILDYITDFVYIKDLDRFMNDKFGINPKHFYVSKEKIITKELLTSEHILALKEIYKADFEIVEKFKDKFYK